MWDNPTRKIQDRPSPNGLDIFEKIILPAIMLNQDKSTKTRNASTCAVECVVFLHFPVTERGGER